MKGSRNHTQDRQSWNWGKMRLSILNEETGTEGEDQLLVLKVTTPLTIREKGLKVEILTE